MTLTIELPNSLVEEFHERGIPEEEMRAVAIAALEIWLAQEHSRNGRRFSESAVPFVQRLIPEDHELFDALAQR